MGFSTRIKARIMGEPGAKGKGADWLVRVLGISREALLALREEVGNMMREAHLEDRGLSQKNLRHRVSRRLTKRIAMQAAAVGGIMAAPAALPIVGTLGTAVAGTTVDFIYMVRRQIELCYAISAVYNSNMDEEELKAVTLALLGFSGAGQMFKEIASSTLRNVVDATSVSYLKMGFREAASEVAAKITPRFFGRAYRLIPLVSIPLNASVNIVSTMMVGNRASKYFSTWEEDQEGTVPWETEKRTCEPSQIS
jgi:molybdenum cofactor biosynthesis enzyme